MRRTTPVLRRRGDVYASYDTEHCPTWLVCPETIFKMFDVLPKHISLIVDTRPAKTAIRIILRPSGDYRAYWCAPEYTIQWSQLYEDLQDAAREFLDAGHDTVYLMMYRHD